MGVDVTAFLRGLTELVELANSGEGGVAGVQAAAELARSATGAVGATFVEYGRGGGRVIVATEACTWALGRPIALNDPAVVRMLSGPVVQELTLDQLTEDTRRQLAARGMR